MTGAIKLIFQKHIKIDSYQELDSGIHENIPNNDLSELI